MKEKCPYCNHEIEINHEDGYGYAEDEMFNQECENCGKTFVFTTSILFYHNLSKADCLNGGEHKYIPTVSFPKIYTQMVCPACGDSRLPTDEELNEILNPEAKS